MSTELRNHINHLAMQFASQLMAALKTASLSDLAAESASQSGWAGGGKRGPGRPAKGASAKGSSDGAGAPPRSGKRRRRSAADIGETVDAIVKLLKTNTKGLRAEQIRAKLGLARKEIPRPIAMALEAKKITKKGQKRATTYFAK